MLFLLHYPLKDNHFRLHSGELQVECVLHKIEICNICQHDFNSSLCSHTKGLSYGGKECKPNEEKYCNICSENIIYCEHKEGVVYLLYNIIKPHL